MAKPIEPRILILDGEMSDLCADMGELLVFGYMWVWDEKPTTLNIVDTSEFKKDTQYYT